MLRPLFVGVVGSLCIAFAACSHAPVADFSVFPDAGEDATQSGSEAGLPPNDFDSSPIVVNEAAPPPPAGDACTGDTCAEAGPATCGDGVIEPGEQCDDGNDLDGDGCSATCALEPGYSCTTPGQACIRTWVCGNKALDPGETCDDGNITSGDGCSSTCQLEDGWQCPIVGAPCVAAQCGDGLLAGSEACDDGNMVAGDGCDATCRVEPGWACIASATPPPASACHKTVCGDGKKEGSEQCDDGNLIPYDGCSPSCAIEPTCDSTGGCQGVCGDGLVFPGEQCDDGNTVSGDGCSSTCMVEAGFTCQTTVQAPQSTLVIPILYRDMLYFNTGAAGANGSAATFPTPRPVGGGHPDFNNLDPDRVVTGLVQPTLGADHEPAWLADGAGAAQTLSGATDFCWWYHEAGCGDGGANPFDKLVYLDAAGNPQTLTLTQGASGTYTYLNHQFFPIDGLGWNAGTNPQVDLDCEPAPDGGVPDGGVFSHGPHNFSFTSELHYIFTFQADVAASVNPAIFSFTGDDSVWAFINGHLVVDLGGVHNPAPGTVTLDTAEAATLGLVDGGWYSIDVFQAEQHVCRSTYALTLSNFVHMVSTCQTTCGDGIVAGKEQCDTGPNDVPAATAYGNGVCTDQCTLAPYCGDRVTEAAFGEQCDDGTNLATYGGKNPMVCGPGCKFAGYCGDGVVNGPEACDNGAANVPAATAYGAGLCTDSCTAAPFCGDGITQTQFGEACDGQPNCNSVCQMGPAQ